MSNAAPCAGSMFHVTESESEAQGGRANEVLDSTKAVAPAAIVTPTIVVEPSARAACRRSQRVPHVIVGGASARGPSIACVAPDTASEPTVEIPTVSAVAPA